MWGVYILFCVFFFLFVLLLNKVDRDPSNEIESEIDRGVTTSRNFFEGHGSPTLGQFHRGRPRKERSDKLELG